jgi:O-antigen/teichoic acid export membrane protein
MRDGGWLAALRADWRERITHDSATVLAGQLAVQSIGLLSSAMLARGLTPDNFGFYGLTGVLVAVGGALADFGLSQGGVRHIADDLKDDPEQARTTAVIFSRLKLLGGLLITLLLAAAAQPLARLLDLPAQNGAAFVRLAALGILAASLAGSVSPIHQARRHFKALVITQLANGALTVLLVGGLFFSGRLTVEQALWIGAITAVFGALIGFWLLPGSWRAIWSLRHQLQGRGQPVARRLLRFSRWLWLSAILTIIVSQLDLLLINQFLPDVTVGLYTLALNLAFKAGLLNQTLYTVLLPSVSSLRSRAEFQDYIKRSLLRSLLPTGAALLALPLLPAFIRIVYGPDYAGAAPIFLALITITLFDLFWTPLGLLAFPLDLPVVIFASNVLRVAVLILLGLLLIPVWGVYGAVAAKLAAKMVGAGFSWWQIQRHLPPHSPGEPA